MEILGIFYIFFFLFAHKQLYAGRHFHGASQMIGVALKTIGIINVVAAYIFLIYAAIKFSIIYAIILPLVAFVFLYIINRIMCKIVMNRAKKQCDIHDPTFFSFYNAQCDIATTILAIIGIFFNILIIIGFIITSILG